MPIALAPANLAALLKPGDRVFVAGGSGVPVPFLDALYANPDASRGIELVTSIAPGIDNPLKPELLDPTARVQCLFLQPGLASAHRAGRVEHLATSYAGFVRLVADGPEFDLAVIVTAPPDASGKCSLGPSVEFIPAVLARSRKVLAIVSPSYPALPASPGILLSAIDYHCEIPVRPPVYAVADDESTRKIARQIAAIIPHGATVQAGIGKVPTALFAALCGHRGLRLFSGMLSDGFMDLFEAGALDADFIHTACVIAGSGPFYDWAMTYPNLAVQGCEVTHDATVLAGLERFHAVNSALEVDLFGQCNLEVSGGESVSGAGGAPDFARAARLSRGGRSIVALNAMARRGTVTRVVSRLPAPGLVTLPRTDVDTIITEFGVADLRGLGTHARAKALIEVAAPPFRGQLVAEWAEIASRL